MEKQAKSRRKKQIGLIGVILLLAAAGLIAYSNTFSVPFQWDDKKQILLNEDIHELSTFKSSSIWLDVNQRPLSKFTLALNWAAGEEDVFGYHLVNLVLHVITAFLVYLLTVFSIRQLISTENIDRRWTQSTAIFAALVFLLHPVQTMAVTYIIQRMTVMSALFYILGLYLYARGRITFLKDGRLKRSVFLVALAVGSGILALLSKQNAATFPAAFLLYEFFFIRRPDGRLCRKYLIPAASLLGVAFLVVLLGGYLPAETDRFTRIEYFIAQLGVLHKYLLLLIAPLNQAADYFIQPGDPLVGAAGITGMILLIVLILLGIYSYRKNNLLSFGIFFFFLSASIESGLIPIKDIMMEHRMYLPMMGFGFVLAGLIVHFIPFRRLKIFYIAAGLVLVALTVSTFSRNRVWQSEIRLWEDSLENNPRSARAMNNLGYAIKSNALSIPDRATRAKELNRALNYFTTAMGGDTLFTEAYLNRGMTYIELGEYQKALADINRITARQPRQRYLKFYLEGVIYARQGAMQPALQKLDEAIRLNPDFAMLYTWRGLVNEALENTRKALNDFRLSLELDPGQTILMINITNAYYKLGELEEALYWGRQARAAGELLDPAFLESIEQQLNEQGEQN